jgi:aspartate aminotransferase-like enzyme
MPHKRLFIPGPTEVRPENLAALGRPQIGHRSDEFKQLYAGVVGKLERLLETTQPVFLFTCSSTGVWEAAIRNCVGERVLCCMQGAFSDRWLEVARANGKEADPLRVEWGRAVRAEAIDRALASGRYDAITLVHNETSTGVMNHLDEIADVMRKYPDVMFLVDAVSSMAGVRVPVDAYRIDVCLAGLQKAFSLPAGLTVASVSTRALDRARSISNRGYYFDFIEMLKYHERSQTPATPAIPQIHALDAQLDDILAEGLENRYARHAVLAQIVQDWARSRFALFAEEGFLSATLTCVRNTRGISVADLNRELGRQWLQISNGYGDLKEKTFRIALATIDRILAIPGAQSDATGRGPESRTRAADRR